MYIRTLSIALGLIVLIVAWTGQDAYAEIASTKKNTRVMQRKGEKSRVIKRLPAGKKVKVLAREGGWVKIRVEGHTGWVKSSSLSAPKRSAGKGRKARFGRRGKDGTAPGDRVGADAVSGAKVPPDKAGKPDRSDDGGDDDDDDSGEGDDDDDKPADGNTGKSDAGDGGKSSGDTKDDVPRTAAKSALRRLDQQAEDDMKSGDDNDSDSDDNNADDSDADDNADDADNDDASEDLDVMMVVKSDKVAMRRQPEKQGKKLDTLYKGATLNVLKRSPDGGWFFVENSNGEQGWIRASAVRVPGAGYSDLMLRMGAHAGYTNVTQRFFSDGGPNYELSLYDLSTGAAVATLGGDVLYHATPHVVVGGDLSYVNTYATPGIEYQDLNGNQTQTAFMMHELNVGGAVGVDLRDSHGILMYGRVGYYYSMFSVSNYDDATVNLARLPSEILNGMIVGGRIEVARVAGPVGLRVGGDVIVPSLFTRTQTDGLKDGELVTAEGFWSGAHLTYRLASLDVEAGYRFAFAKTIWEGVSQRPTGAIRNAFRKDYTHLVSVGVGKSF